MFTSIFHSAALWKYCGILSNRLAKTKRMLISPSFVAYLKDFIVWGFQSIWIGTSSICTRFEFCCRSERVNCPRGPNPNRLRPLLATALRYATRLNIWPDFKVELSSFVAYLKGFEGLKSRSIKTSSFNNFNLSFVFEGPKTKSIETSSTNDFEMCNKISYFSIQKNQVRCSAQSCCTSQMSLEIPTSKTNCNITKSLRFPLDMNLQILDGSSRDTKLQGQAWSCGTNRDHETWEVKIKQSDLHVVCELLPSDKWEDRLRREHSQTMGLSNVGLDSGDQLVYQAHK